MLSLQTLWCAIWLDRLTGHRTFSMLFNLLMVYHFKFYSWLDFNKCARILSVQKGAGLVAVATKVGRAVECCFQILFLYDVTQEHTWLWKGVHLCSEFVCQFQLLDLDFVQIKLYFLLLVIASFKLLLQSFALLSHFFVLNLVFLQFEALVYICLNVAFLLLSDLLIN